MSTQCPRPIKRPLFEIRLKRPLVKIKNCERELPIKNKSQIYKELLEEAPHFWTDFALTNLSQTAALLYEKLPGLNWVGFYLLQGQKLRLGPFCGKPACMDIDLGRGVCGKSALEKRILVVPNVHEFDDHIACDSASNSEIVVPILVRGQVIGVLDLDSPNFSNFDHLDALHLESLVRSLIQKTYS